MNKQLYLFLHFTVIVTEGITDKKSIDTKEPSTEATGEIRIDRCCACALTLNSIRRAVFISRAKEDVFT